MPDVVLTLLLFFMMTTVFSQFTGIQVELPEAQHTQKLDIKKNICYIHVNVPDEIVVDDNEVTINTHYLLLADKIRSNP